MTAMRTRHGCTLGLAAPALLCALFWPVPPVSAAETDLPTVRAAEADPCAVPDELLLDNDGLPQTAARLRAGGPVAIVAIGGASTRGVGPPGQSYPARLQEELRRRYPGVAFQVVNRGVARQTAAEMAERFDSDVLPLRPTLVIWETGTNDAVHGIDPDTFGAALGEGLDVLAAQGIDVMLVDMQYSRESSLVVNFDPYLDVMRNVADIHNVRRFRRYDIMKYWSENELIEFDAPDLPADRRMRLAGETYACLAQRMADVIGMAIHSDGLPDR